jgi:hypothetical protein
MNAIASGDSAEACPRCGAIYAKATASGARPVPARRPLEYSANVGELTQLSNEVVDRKALKLAGLMAIPILVVFGWSMWPKPPDPEAGRRHLAAVNRARVKDTIANYWRNHGSDRCGDSTAVVEAFQELEAQSASALDAPRNTDSALWKRIQAEACRVKGSL